MSSVCLVTTHFRFVTVESKRWFRQIISLIFTLIIPAKFSSIRTDPFYVGKWSLYKFLVHVIVHIWISFSFPPTWSTHACEDPSAMQLIILDFLCLFSVYYVVVLLTGSKPYIVEEVMIWRYENPAGLVSLQCVFSRNLSGLLLERLALIFLMVVSAHLNGFFRKIFTQIGYAHWIFGTPQSSLFHGWKRISPRFILETLHENL